MAWRTRSFFSDLLYLFRRPFFLITFITFLMKSVATIQAIVRSYKGSASRLSGSTTIVGAYNGKSVANTTQRESHSFRSTVNLILGDEK